MYAGHELPIDLLYKIDCMINEEMKSVLLYEHGTPGSYVFHFVSKKFHNFVGGFGKKTIHEKAYEIYQENPEIYKISLMIYIPS
jgi:phage/plasmid-associated DNA primase